MGACPPLFKVTLAFRDLDALGGVQKPLPQALLAGRGNAEEGVSLPPLTPPKEGGDYRVWLFRHTLHTLLTRASWLLPRGDRS